MNPVNSYNQPPSKKTRNTAPASVSTSASSVSTSSTPVSASVSVAVSSSTSATTGSSPTSTAPTVQDDVLNITRITEVPWKPVNHFKHGKDEYAAVYSLLNNAEDKEFTDRAVNSHLLGMMYLANMATIRNSEFQQQLLNDLLPVFIKIIVRRGFDLNAITKEDLDELLKASINAFGHDDPSVGAIYVKFIYTTVEDCMQACKALLKGRKEHCGGKGRFFVRRLLEKLEKMEPTAYITLPYVGETSRQSFPTRMAQMYPNLLYKMINELSPRAVLYEIKIGTVNEGNSIHSRNLEAFCAALMCLNTKVTRSAVPRAGATPSQGGRAAATTAAVGGEAGGEEGVAVEQDAAGCLCLMGDATAFNNVHCGERLGWSKRKGHDIHDWVKENCNDDNMNTPVIEMVNRSIPVLDFLLNGWKDIATYINESDRSKSKSRKVRENTASNHERKRIEDITVQDFARYWGKLIGDTNVQEKRGCFNPDNWKIRGDETMEQHYKTVLEEYKDKIEKEPSGLYFPTSTTLQSYFASIRTAENEDVNERIPGYRAAFWLEREEELDHLVIKELWEEALVMKNYFQIHNTEERRDYQESMSKSEDSFHIEE